MTNRNYLATIVVDPRGADGTNNEMIPKLSEAILQSEGEVLKLEIDPKSHAAWTGGKQKILDKGRISNFNKKFQNFRSEKSS